MIDKAARRLYEHQAWAMGGYPAWQSVPATVQEAYRRWAADVIKAIRVPSEAMNSAGTNVGEWRLDTDGDSMAGNAGDVFTAMIDAALKDAPRTMKLAS